MTKRARIAALEAAVATLTARVVELEARPHLVVKEKPLPLGWTGTVTTGGVVSDNGMPTIYGNSVGAQ